MLFSLISSLLIQSAVAVPIQVNQQGRLLDVDGEGLTGANQMVFMLFDSEENGNIYWSETLTVNFTNGYYSTLLGTDEENNPLDDSVFAQYPLYMEIKINGEVLSPRHPLASVPYAQIAGVAESVDGGVVNASEVNVNGQPVIDGSGNWVGTAPTVDFMDVANRPPGLDDGDDDTQLDQQGVLGYVNGSQVNLGANSQVDGSDIVTANSFVGYLPSDLSDGDNDLLASISCAVGEIISWDGQGWVCTSDNTLSYTDIENHLLNNPIDLNIDTTIGGTTIVTSADDSDTLASLSCQNDGEIARYDLVLDEWYCSTDIDTDTVLDQAGVLAHVNGEALSLASGTQVNGSDVVTVDTFTSNLPSDLADGDADTLASLSCAQGELAAWDGNSSWVCVSDNTLDESTVEGYITNGAIDLYAGSQVDGNAILTSTSQLDWNKLDNVPNGLADGDDDTQLDSATVVSYVESGSVNLAQGSQVNSRNIVGQPSVCTNGQVLVYNSANNDWECGDDTDTTLTPTEMQAAVEAMSLNLQNVPQVNGENVLVESSTLNPTNIDASAASDGQVLTVSSGIANWVTPESNGNLSRYIFEDVNPDDSIEIEILGLDTPIVQIYFSDSSGNWIQGGYFGQEMPFYASYCLSCGNGSSGDLHITQNTTLTAATYQLSSLTIDQGVTLNFTGSSFPQFLVDGTITINGVIDVSAVNSTPGPGGFSAGYGPGRGDDGDDICHHSDGSGGGGAAHYTNGSCANGHPSCGQTNACSSGTYAVPTVDQLTGGSGGGQSYSGASGGAGSGSIKLVAHNILGTGQIIANGGDGSNTSQGGGGGSGGAIWLRSATISTDLTFSVSGGNGPNRGGNGGSGYVRIDSHDTHNADYQGSTDGLNPIVFNNFYVSHTSDETIQVTNNSNSIQDILVVISN